MNKKVLLIVFLMNIVFSSINSQEIKKVIVKKDTIFGISSSGLYLDTINCDTGCYLPDIAGDYQFLDTLIIEPSAKLFARNTGNAGSWKNQLIVEKYLEVKNGAKLEGTGDTVIVGVKETHFINDAGNDSVKNISLNIHDKQLTIGGDYPTTLVNLLSTWNGRHVHLDTTCEVLNQVLNGFRTTIFLHGHTLLLSDSAHFKNLTTNNESDNYSFIIPDSIDGGEVKRMISSKNIGMIDTIPFGMITKNDSGTWIQLKLNPGVSLGADPYITYSLIPDSHPSKGSVTSYLNNYADVTGNGINSIDYDLAMGYRKADVTGDTLSLVNAHFTSNWHTKGSVAHDNKLISLSNLTEWGELTALGGPMPKKYIPSQNAMNVSLDSIVKLQFIEDVDSVDFSGIVINNESMSPVGGIAYSWMNDSNMVTVNHNPYNKYSEMYTVTIPSGIVINTNGIVNPDISWSFMTIPDLHVSALLPADTSKDISIDSTVAIVFNQQVSEVDLSTLQLQSVKQGSVNITSSYLETDNRTVIINHDDFPEDDTITVIIPDSIVISDFGVYSEDTSWVFYTGTISGKNSLVNDDLNISVSPNPVQDILYIKGLNTDEYISLYDQTGRIVFEERCDDQDMMIDLSHLPKGVYVLKTGNTKQKIIKY